MPNPYVPEGRPSTGGAGKVAVDGQAISDCLKRMLEVEQILAGVRSTLIEASGSDISVQAIEPKVASNSPRSEPKVPSSTSHNAKVGSLSSEPKVASTVPSDIKAKASAEVQWETVASLKERDLALVPSGPPAAQPLAPPPPPEPAKPRSKWSSIDRPGLVDQVVINTINLADEAKGTSGTAAPASDGRATLPAGGTCVKQVWFVPICGGGRLRMPILHPEGQFRLMWLIIGFSFIIFEAFTIPFYLSYDVDPSGFFFGLASSINGYFLLDILLSFVTGFVQAGQLVMEPGRIARRYIFGWFMPDIIAGIPWEWLPDSASGPMSFTRGIRFIRAFRLLRLTRLFRIMRLNIVTEKLEICIEANQGFMFLVGVMRILVLLFGVTHWAACAWYTMGMREQSEPDKTWVEEYIGDRWSEDHTFQRYVISLYFTLTTMTTVGYGDMSARNLEETCFVLVLLLVASIVFAGLMGVLTDLISNLNSETNVRNDRKAQLSRYMRWRAVPNDLFLTIRQHILFLWDENEGYETYEEDIKAQLTPALKTELCFHIYGRLLYASPFFAWMKDYSICLKQLATMVQSLFLSRGDMLFRVGQRNEQMYLLLSGSVWLTRNESLFQCDRLFSHELQDLKEGIEGFKIPRHRDSGLYNVGKQILKKRKKMPKSTTHIMKGEVLNGWAKTEMKSTSVDLEQEPPVKRFYGIDHSGNPIFDSIVLKEATLQLLRRDVTEKRAARVIQRRWRQKRGSKGLKSKPTMKVSAMQSKTINAPAYFGESCLWVPMDQWRTEEPPLYTYTARCESRSELVYIPREAVQQIVERFSPWLGERFEVFRQSVLASVGAMMEVTAPGKRAAPHAQAWPVDWASMDLSPPEDDVSMNAMHCKTLLRAAVPTRAQMTILRSAGTHSRPAMPRVPTMNFDRDAPAAPGGRLPPSRMQSGLGGERHTS